MSDTITPISPQDLPQIIEIFKNDLVTIQQSFLDKQIERKRSNPGQIDLQNELKQAVQYISKVEAFQNDVLTRIVQVLKGLTYSINTDADNHHHHYEKIEDLESTITKLKDHITELEQHIEKEEYANDKLKKQLEEAQQRISQLKEVSQQKQLLKKQDQNLNAQVLVDNKQFEVKIKSLEEANNQLLKVVTDNKLKIQNISAETMEKQIKIIQLEKSLLKYENKLIIEIEKREKIEATLEQKKELINQMQEQINAQTNTYQYTGKQRLSLMRSFTKQSIVHVPIPISAELGGGIQQMDLDSFRIQNNPMIKSFAEQNDTYDWNHNYRMDAVNTSLRGSIELVDLGPINLQSNQVSSSIKKQRTQPCFFNPYLSHYTLSCQSIKIKLMQQGNSQCMIVQMQNKYKQLIGSKTPIHQWSDWIKKTLLEQSRKK